MRITASPGRRPKTGPGGEGRGAGGVFLGGDDRQQPTRAAGLTIAYAASRIPADAFLAVLDVFVIAAAYTTLLLLRFDLSVPDEYWERFGLFLVAALVVHLVANRVLAHLRAHVGARERRRGPAAARSPARVGGAARCCSAASRRSASRSRSCSSGRWSRRSSWAPPASSPASSRSGVGRGQPPGLRVAVVGAGRAGGCRPSARCAQRPHLGLRPVAILDDNPRIQGRSLNGVPVVGTDRRPRAASSPSSRCTRCSWPSRRRAARARRAGRRAAPPLPASR